MCAKQHLMVINARVFNDLCKHERLGYNFYGFDIAAWDCEHARIAFTGNYEKFAPIPTCVSSLCQRPLPGGREPFWVFVR